MTMSTSTTRKLNLSNCAHEELFKAMARIEAKLAKTSVRDKNRVAYLVKHITVMAEHYVPSESDNINSTRLGNPQFRDWLPSDFGADARYWEKKGITGGMLLTGTYLNVHTGQHNGVLQTMFGSQVNILSPAFQTIYQNFICYPSSLHLETQSKISEIIAEEIKQETRTGRKEVGMFYALERK